MLDQDGWIYCDFCKDGLNNSGSETFIQVDKRICIQDGKIPMWHISYSGELFYCDFDCCVKHQQQDGVSSPKQGETVRAEDVLLQLDENSDLLKMAEDAIEVRKKRESDKVECWGVKDVNGR